MTDEGTHPTSAAPPVPVGVTAHIDVVVPARDEEDRIAACLEALLTARRRLAAVRPHVTSAVTVVLDDCHDGTAAIARRAAGATVGVQVVEVLAGSVGPARVFGVTHALAFPGPPPERRWIANTDADSRVDPEWLVQQADALLDGVELLVGAVVPDPADMTADGHDRWRATHPPGAALGHVHGANLGVRADLLVALGGFARVDEHEDVLLVDLARARGARVATTEASPVVTSGRTIGRTPGGYARHLRETYSTRIA